MRPNAYRGNSLALVSRSHNAPHGRILQRKWLLSDSKLSCANLKFQPIHHPPRVQPLQIQQKRNALPVIAPFCLPVRQILRTDDRKINGRSLVNEAQGKPAAPEQLILKGIILASRHGIIEVANVEVRFDGQPGQDVGGQVGGQVGRNDEVIAAA